MLSREVASSMRGRALEATVTPFGFREALRHKGQEPPQSERLTKSQQSRLDAALITYLCEGGFPEAQGLETRSRLTLLRSYVDVVLLRDVIERHNIAQPQVLRWLVQQLLANAAGGFSINKFHGDLRSRGVSVGKETLYQLLDHLEDAFLLHSVSLASDSVRRQQVNPRKVYPVDTGLMALYDTSGKTNLGHALETAVLHALLRSGAEVGYVLTTHSYEVDFYARLPDGEQWLVQVCLDVSDSDTLHREIRALNDAGSMWPNAKKHLISLNAPATLGLPDDITHHPASHWFLRMP